jgi:DNA end-binding protein Ku
VVKLYPVTRRQHVARSVWTGTISFGLVSIPVKLYNATIPRDVRFNLFDRETGRRIRYRREAGPPAEAAQPGSLRSPGEGERPGSPPSPPGGAPSRPAERSIDDVEAVALEPGRRSTVPLEDVVKGYEVAPDRYVLVSPEELQALEPERSRSIDIEEFVDLAEVDPVFFDRSYYVGPRRGAEKPYALLLEALRQTGRAGVARFVLRSKSYLAAIRPMDEVLMLHTLFYADEVREVKELDNVPVYATPSEREVAMAVKLIDLLVATWDPSRHRDEYREQVLELIRSKAESAGATVEVVAEPIQAESKLPELMEALRASVEAARTAKGEESPERPKRPRRRTS